MKSLITPLAFLLLLANCQKNFKENKLVKEPSPYLQLHKDNPVWWQSWNTDVLEYAKNQKKLILISVGYYTCHWCHVMEEEVFAHKEFADVANLNFVSIKIDREQRPDLDAHFMKALRAITKGAGWPTTLVLTPDLKPIFGATYVPRDKMIYILEELQKAWIEKRDALQERGNKVQQWLDNSVAPSHLSFDQNYELLDKFYSEFKKVYDPVQGGRKGPMKFPINDDLRVLLRQNFRKKEAKALEMVKRTLFKMVKGGLFDHLQGGVHRYSTNSNWTLPHFEKMLYDQASFLNILTEYYQKDPHPLLKHSLELTVEFLFNLMQNPKGGFYSAIDADSNGKEGLFYSWERNELENALSKEEYKDFRKYFSLLGQQKSLENRQLFVRHSDNILPPDSPIIKKLTEQRLSHSPPQVDKKIITAWNGLLLEPLARVARMWPSQDLDNTIQKTVNYLLKKHKRGPGHLYRYSINGKPFHKGVLDDYAFLVHGLIAAYQTTFQESYLLEAYQIHKTMVKLFFDPETNGFFYGQKSEDSLPPLKIYKDTVRPSAQSIIYSNQKKLGLYFANRKIENAANQLATSFPDSLESYPLGFPRFLQELDFTLGSAVELVISGDLKDCKNAISEISQTFFPNILYACSKEGRSRIPLISKKIPLNGKTTFYVCRKGVCLEPTHDFSKAKSQILN